MSIAEFRLFFSYIKKKLFLFCVFYPFFLNFLDYPYDFERLSLILPKKKYVFAFTNVKKCVIIGAITKEKEIVCKRKIRCLVNATGGY